MTDRTAAPPPATAPALRTEHPLPLLLALLAIILAVRLLGLAVSNAELFFDEAQYWAWAQQPAFGYFTKPPLIAWLIGGATALCGDTPFCVRMPSPVIHLATSLVVYGVALRLFDRRIAFWAALLFNLMPGLSVSAILMSTDVPLLFFWSLGLFAIVRQVARPSLADGLLLGVAVGLGLNAKYAMIYLPLCFALYAAVAREARPALRHPGTWLALPVAALLIAPNVVWNVQNGFATFAHTRDNVAWAERFPNLLGVLEFVGTQAAIIGPVPFAAFALAAFAGRGVADGPRRLLAFHALPVFALITAQALLSRAHGNWAATAFPAAMILAAAAMVRLDWRRGLRATLVISALALAGASAAGAMVGTLTVGPLGGELGKLTGWGRLAADVARVARAEGIGTVVFAERGLTASMIYELRDSGLDVRAWRPDPNHPADHFELTRPWLTSDPGPVLFVTIGEAPPPVPQPRIRKVETIPTSVFIAKRRGWIAAAYRID